jgi:hypothetical protein
MDKTYDTVSIWMKKKEESCQTAYHVRMIPQLYTRLPQEKISTENNFLYKLHTLLWRSEHSLGRLSWPTTQIT